jgi:hypothetical protein
MTYYEFTISPVSYQIAIILTEGVELAHRQEGPFEVTLYYLPDNFFVEVYRESWTDVMAKIRSFKEAVELERYASRIKLPGWLT